MTTKYHGDLNSTLSHRLHKIKITKPQAELVVKSICEDYHISVPKVVFTGKKTRCNLGKYYKTKDLITLQAHLEGESVGCLIHELSHHVAYKQFTGSGKLQSHGVVFKNTQRMLLQYVEMHTKELNIPGLEDIFTTFNRNVAKQLTEAPTDTRPVLMITSPTVIKISRAIDKIMNSRNVAILGLLKSLPSGTGLSKEDIGKKINQALGINRNSWDTPMYELKKAGLVTQDSETKLYQIHGGNHGKSM